MSGTVRRRVTRDGRSRLGRDEAERVRVVSKATKAPPGISRLMAAPRGLGKAQAVLAGLGGLHVASSAVTFQSVRAAVSESARTISGTWPKTTTTPVSSGEEAPNAQGDPIGNC